MKEYEDFWKKFEFVWDYASSSTHFFAKAYSTSSDKHKLLGKSCDYNNRSNNYCPQSFPKKTSLANQSTIQVRCQFCDKSGYIAKNYFQIKPQQSSAQPTTNHAITNN